MQTKLKLRTLLDAYPATQALRGGELGSALIDFDFAPVKRANQGFKAAIRDGAFDAGEIAIAAFLQAKEHGKPLTLLPATILGRFQHHCIAYNSKHGVVSPEDLNGRTIGVRAYTQTTGMWVRGILQNQYGADLDSITWLTFEEAHVAEYRNPPNVKLLADGNLQTMLLDGELDAAMLGNEMPDDPWLRTVIPDPQAAAIAWYDQTGAIPINHIAFIRSDISRDHPDAVREYFRMLKESKAAIGPVDGLDTHPYGLEALRPSLELAIEYSLQQRLISRRFTVEELFDEVTAELA